MSLKCRLQNSGNLIWHQCAYLFVQRWGDCLAKYIMVPGVKGFHDFRYKTIIHMLGIQLSWHSSWTNIFDANLLEGVCWLPLWRNTYVSLHRLLRILVKKSSLANATVTLEMQLITNIMLVFHRWKYIDMLPDHGIDNTRLQGPLTKYVTLRVAHEPGMSVPFSPRVSDGYRDR